MICLSNKRWSKIIYILLKYKEPITIEELANNFKVSNRTIRADLNKLQEKFDQENISLRKKPGVGVWIELKQVNRRKLKEQLIKTNSYQNKSYSFDRRNEITKKLLLEEQKHSINSLGVELYVSKSTIYSDLIKVENWLNKYDLKLEKSSSLEIQIKGSERNKRQAIINLLFEAIDKELLQEVKELLINNQSVKIESYSYLQDFCALIDLKKIKELINMVEAKRDILFSKKAILNLTFYIAVSVKRIQKGKRVNLAKDSLERLKNMEAFELAKKIASKAEQWLGVNFSEAEIGMNLLQVLCSKLLYKKGQLNSKQEIIQLVGEKIYLIARKLSSFFESKLNTSLKTDKDFFSGLILHLRYVINRLEYSINNKAIADLDLYLVEEIKRNNLYIFKLVRESKKIFKEFGYSPTQVDIEYIAILLVAAIERQRDKVKAAVIFNEKIAMNQLLAARLENKIPELKIEKKLYYRDLKTSTLSDVDLVISSEPLSDISEVIVVSPLIDSTDIEAIKDKIADLKIRVE